MAYCRLAVGSWRGSRRVWLSTRRAAQRCEHGERTGQAGDHGLRCACGANQRRTRSQPLQGDTVTLVCHTCEAFAAHVTVLAACTSMRSRHCSSPKEVGRKDVCAHSTSHIDHTSRQVLGRVLWFTTSESIKIIYDFQKMRRLLLAGYYQTKIISYTIIL